MRKKLYSWIVLAVVLIACSDFANNSVPNNPQPAPIPDSAFCGPAQINLTALCNNDSVKNNYCCLIVAPTKLNKSFEQFCTETQTNGIPLNANCLSTITSCDQINTTCKINK